MWAGRTDKEKAQFMKGIAKAYEDIGGNPEHLTIIIHDIPKSNWGKGGIQVTQIASK